MLSGLCSLLNGFDLNVVESLCFEFSIRQVARKLLERLCQDFRCQPRLLSRLSLHGLTERFAMDADVLHRTDKLERTLLDLTHIFGCGSQSTLEDRTTH